MESIKLRGEYIKLGQALKAAGYVENGGAAKDVILDGLVKVKYARCVGKNFSVEIKYYLKERKSKFCKWLLSL